MHLTQFLIFELSDQCNLGSAHKLCPNQSPERYAHLDTRRTLDEATILSIASRAYQVHNFRGLIGWHYYNEPTLTETSMLRLMDNIKRQVPQARFVLWTNGTRLPENLARYRQFEQVYITNYDGADFSRVTTELPQTKILRPTMDGRLGQVDRESDRPCYRSFTEFIIDYHGNVHLCCFDWRGKACMGNVFAESFGAILSRFQAARMAMVGERMTEDAPASCRRCAFRIGSFSNFDPVVAKAAADYAAQLRQSLAEAKSGRPNAGRPAVIFAHYNCPGGDLPESRLYEQLAWNDAYYRQSAARVYVVTDKARVLPDYAACLVLPASALPQHDGHTVFSQAIAKNCGVAAALADERDPIIVCDTDIQFTPPAWHRLVKVDGWSAIIPVCCMRRRCDYLDGEDRRDKGCTGTVAMRAENWKRLRYDERFAGYGGEDGAFLNSITRAGLRVDRATEIYHMPHFAGESPQRQPGHGSEGCYNRANGFNPDMFGANRYP